MQKTLKKTLSIILAVLMIAATIPFAFAAEDYTYDEATDTYTVYTFVGLETALTAGGNIILGADIIRDDPTVLTAVPENITAVLDLNGNTITIDPSVVPSFNYEIINVNGNLTIKDSGINGTIDSTASRVSPCLRVEGGSLTIDAGNFICDTNLALAVDVFSGNAVINGGAFTNFNVLDEGKAVINGGEFQGEIWTSGSLIINGGTFYGKEYTFGGTFDIYGGEFHENPSKYVAEGCDITENDNGTWTVTCNHSFTNYVETTAPTCTETGIATAKCDICSIATDEKEIPSTDHKDEDGDYKCDYDCGYEFEKPEEAFKPSLNAQTNADGSQIRFVACVDSLNYKEVGFVITNANNKEQTTTKISKTVYNSIVAGGKKLTAADITGDEDMKYILTYTVKNLPENAAFEVISFVVNLDGTIIYGETETYTVADMLA